MPWCSTGAFFSWVVPPLAWASFALVACSRTELSSAGPADNGSSHTARSPESLSGSFLLPRCGVKEAVVEHREVLQRRVCWSFEAMQCVSSVSWFGCSYTESASFCRGKLGKYKMCVQGTSCLPQTKSGAMEKQTNRGAPPRGGAVEKMHLFEN